MRVIQDKDSKLMEQEQEFQDEFQKISQDRNNLQEQNNQMKYLMSKLKS